MPELPEVEAYRKYLEVALFESPIVGIELLREKVLKAPLDEAKQALLGKRFVSTQRIGKYLFLEVEGGPWLMMHFGMTGKPEFYQDEELQPRHTRFVIHFQSGLKLAYVSMRMFGRIELIDSISTYQQTKKLGVDATQVDRETFGAYIKSRKAAIKTVLLHQQAFAGIGNWIADEMLFQARIHPEVKAHQLTDQQLYVLYDKMKEVLEVAIKEEANYHNFPDHFMVKGRWGDGLCPLTGDDLVRIVVGGRGTYLSEQLQQI